jgi:cyanophycinase
MLRPPTFGFNSRRLAHAGAATVFLAAALASAPAAADAPPKERLNPDGVEGAVILCGDKVPDRALDRFFDRAGKDKAQIVVAFEDKADREIAEKLAGELTERKPASIGVFQANAEDEKFREALRAATGVWLTGDRDAGLMDEIRAVQKRGVAAASGAASAAWPLLPGAVVEPRLDGDKAKDRLFEAVEKSPGRFGLGLGDGAAVVVRGRRLDALGDGSVTACLGKSEAKPRREIEIAEKTPNDFTLLRRAALARAEPPFPPKEPPAPEVAKGALVIVGGGGMPADVTAKFIELAGGPDAEIVVLPTANPGGNPDAEAAFLKRAGAKNVVLLPARTLEEVGDPKTLETLKKAGGVWFGGGRQWHFVDAYEGTKAAEAFRDVLRRGGVIGGSSAGATIQGDYLCRGSPLGNLEMMCEGYERGLGFLPGVAIDQHFSQRKRFADMTALMKAYPQLLGVGLDEATALVVTGHEAAVMGNGAAHFYDAGKPAEEGKPDYEAVQAGGRYDLKARKVLEPGG